MLTTQQEKGILQNERANKCRKLPKIPPKNITHGF